MSEMLLAVERQAIVEHAQRLQADRLTTATSGNLSARRGELVAPYATFGSDELAAGVVEALGRGLRS